MKNRSSLAIFTTILSVLASFALLPQMQAAPQVAPPPDGRYPGFTTAEGCNALQFLGAGAGNTGVGWYALHLVGDANFNTAVGTGALVLNTGDNNTAVGAAALLLNTTGIDNTAVGTDALLNNTEGGRNTALGSFALADNTIGIYNTATGRVALSSNTEGDRNTANGHNALFHNTTGDGNTALGQGALFYTTGSGNIGIGASAGANMTASDNVISIVSPGDATAFTGSDRCYIGNIRGVIVGNSDGINVIVDSDGQLGTSNSSRRFKKDIKPMEQTSETILALKPVTFHYKNQDTKKAENTPQFGLIAEDVAEVNPDLVVRDSDGKPLSVRYDAVNAMLLNEFLKEHRAFVEERRKVEKLEATVASLLAIVKEQSAQIQKVSAHLELSEAAPLTAANGP